LKVTLNQRIALDAKARHGDEKNIKFKGNNKTNNINLKPITLII